MTELSPDLTGRTLGNWTLLRLLGEGGFGAVYEAQHTTIAGRRAAVKVLHPHLAYHKDIKRRFTAEASIASQADHENIVQVFDGGISADGVCYVAMEMLKGSSLARLIHEEKRLDIPRTLNIAIQVASALEAAHGLGVVHRDLKPDNIFITPRKTNPYFIKVLDFGIAKLQNQDSKTSTGTVLGTPLYMSPEQCECLPDIDGRSDLYSLGCILYECLAGKPPYDGPTNMAIMMAHMQQPIPDPTRLVPLPEGLSTLIMQLLAKQRDQRPANAREVISKLRGLAGESVDTRELSGNVFTPTPVVLSAPFGGAKSLTIRQQTGELYGRVRSRHPILFWVTGGAAALGTLALFWILLRSSPGQSPAGHAPSPAAAPPTVVRVDAPDMLPPQPQIKPVEHSPQRAATGSRNKRAGDAAGSQPPSKKSSSGPQDSRSKPSQKKVDRDLYEVPIIR